MIDGCNREIDHLRLSLTDHCNLSCRYCVPADAEPAPRQMMDVGFAEALVHWLSEHHGIRHLRLTGGEPLLYPNLVRLVRSVASLPKLVEISLTTNAQALMQQAVALRDAGLTRINISLDTMDPERFAFITRGGKIEHTLIGVKAAVAAGLTPVKVNMVVQRGYNDDEVVRVAEWGLSAGCLVRFLEVMPLGPSAHMLDKHLVSAAEIREKLTTRFELRAIPQTLGQPATDFAVSGDGVRGTIGIIAATTEPFCDRCRRLRITSYGEVVACIHESRRLDLRCCWDGRTLDVARADAILLESVMNKPAVGSRSQSLTMLSLGG